VLFLTYWELNENMSERDRLDVVCKLRESGLFPPKDVTLLRWDATPDNWGIMLFEAPDNAAAFATIDLWRMAGAGFFKATRTAPAVPVEQGAAIAEPMLAILARA
jgi:hypothetical protein